MWLIQLMLLSFCTLFLFKGCNIGADRTQILSGGYFYRDEGGEIKDILCTKPNGGEIPSTVISFDYDKNFIIAKQRPKIPHYPLYNKEYQYNKGAEQNYFWLIVHEKKLVLGPLLEVEFNKVRKLYNVPDWLKLE